MDCDISGEQLWSWIDRDAPELERHLAACPACRARAAKMREEIGVLVSDAAMAIPLPDQIGPYAIKRLLGEGGQALVYEAEQPSPRRPVALKVLKGGHLVDETRVRHFRRETQTLAHLNHPSIATIYEAGRTQEGLYYFAMELVDGEPLHTFVKNSDLGRRELLALFLELSKAIQYAHEHGVIHRDLKPSNILVDSEGNPKILDFGLARLTQADFVSTVTATKDGRVEGTPRYMSPEQARGDNRKIDARSDQYSLGVIMYEMLTGQPPSDVTLITPESVQVICEYEPSRPSSIDSSLRGDLDAILLKALEKDPQRRYPSVAELADDIAHYLDGEPVAAKRPNAAYYLRKKLSRRTSWVAAGIAVAVIIVMAGAGLRLATQSSNDAIKDRLAVLEIRRALLQYGPTDRAYTEARGAPRRYPTLVEAVVVAAQAYALNHDRNAAISTLVNCLAREPSSWPCAALLEELRANPDRASENGVWTESMAASSEAWYLRSFATLDTDKALTWMGESAVRDPRNELALTGVAYMSEIKGDTEGALAAADDLVALNHHAANWLRYRIVLFAESGRLEEALDDCDRLVTVAPDNYGPYYQRSKIERRLKRYDEANRDMTLAIEMQGQDDHFAAWLYYHRGTLSWLLGKKEAAIADYRKAFDLLTYTTFANARLYVLLREAGRVEEAQRALNDARGQSEVDPWLEMIFDCLSGGLAPHQLAATAEVGGNPLQLCEGYYYAGESSFLDGRIDDARQWYRKCVDTGLEYDPDAVLEAVSEFELATMRLTNLDKMAETKLDAEGR